MTHDQILALLKDGTFTVIDLLGAAHSLLIEQENTRRMNGERTGMTAAQRNYVMAAINAWSGLTLQAMVSGNNAAEAMVRFMEGTE